MLDYDTLSIEELIRRYDEVQLRLKRMPSEKMLNCITDSNERHDELNKLSSCMAESQLIVEFISDWVRESQFDIPVQEMTDSEIVEQVREYIKETVKMFNNC